MIMALSHASPDASEKFIILHKNRLEDFEGIYVGLLVGGPEHGELRDVPTTVSSDHRPVMARIRWRDSTVRTRRRYGGATRWATQSTWTAAAAKHLERMKKHTEWCMSAEPKRSLRACVVATAKLGSLCTETCARWRLG